MACFHTSWRLTELTAARLRQRVNPLHLALVTRCGPAVCGCKHPICEQACRLEGHLYLQHFTKMSPQPLKVPLSPWTKAHWGESGMPWFISVLCTIHLQIQMALCKGFEGCGLEGPDPPTRVMKLHNARLRESPR